GGLPPPGRPRGCWRAGPGTGRWAAGRWTTESTERRPAVSRAPATCLDELNEDLLPGSADSWQAPRRTPAVPVELRPPQHGSLRQRLRAWRSRHLLRQERARAEYHRSRNPERGLPVAAGRAARGVGQLAGRSPYPGGAGRAACAAARFAPPAAARLAGPAPAPPGAGRGRVPPVPEPRPWAAGLRRPGRLGVRQGPDRPAP